jgi:hypothetical protein
MSVMTPRGLKIRLSPQHVFALISRLMAADQRYDAYHVLMTVEAIQSFVPFGGWIAGMFAAFNASGNYAWLIIVGAIVSGRLFGQLMLSQFVWPAPLLLPIIRYTWVFVTGYGLLFLIGAIACYYRLGWMGVGAWFLGTFVGVVLGQIVEILLARWHMKHHGVPLTPSEVAFLGAFALHSAKLGVSQDFEPTEAELAAETWKRSFADYAVKYPESVRRMPDAAALANECFAEIMLAESRR